MSRYSITALALVACQASASVRPEAPPDADEEVRGRPLIELHEALRRAEDAEAAWYEEDESRRARVEALPVPQGDACKVAYDGDEGVFEVGGIPLFFPFDEHTDTQMVGDQASVFNLRRGNTLFVAFGDNPSVQYAACGTGPVAPSSILWTIDCTKGPQRPQPFYEPPEGRYVDFGNAVVAESGDALYVTMSGGLGRFSLRDKSLTKLLDAPACGIEFAYEGDEEERCGTVLFPSKMTSDGFELVVAVPERNCIDMGLVEESFLVDLTSDKERADPRRWRRPTHIQFVMESNGAWLLAASAEASAFNNVLWRSTDKGESWLPIVVDPGEYNDISGIDDVVVDARDPKRMLVQTSRRFRSDRVDSGELFVSDDGGEHWRNLELGEGAELADVWTANGTIDHVFVARGYDGEAQATFESRDGGATWTPSDAKRPAAPPRALPKGLEVSRLGLWRTGPERTLVFPPPNMLAPLSIFGRPIEPTSRKVITWAEYDRAAAAYKRGLELAQAKSYADAIAAFEDAWEIYPNYAYARYEAARASALQGKPKDAMASLEVLHALRGYRELMLLAAAAQEPDFASLRALPRFRTLTTVTRPAPAHDFAFNSGGDSSDEVRIGAVMSDRTEKICLWATSVELEDGSTLALDRFDCRTGAPQGQLRGSGPELMAALEDLGMLVWSLSREDDDDHAKAERWATRTQDKHALPVEETTAKVYRSPSGKRVAGHFEFVDEGDTKTKLIFGEWPR